MTDYPDWQTPQAHANAIATTGVPLLGSPAKLLALTGQAVTAASPYVSPVFKISQIGYDIEIAAETIAAATVPFVKVSLIWVDSVTSAILPLDVYIIPCGQGIRFYAGGRGQCKADTLEIDIQYLDPAQTATVDVNIVQHSKPITVDRWSWHNDNDSGITVPNWTLATLPSDNSCLGLMPAVVIPGSSNEAFLCGMYNGLIGVGINMNTGSLSNLLIEFAPVPSSAYSINNPLGSYMAPPPLLQIPGPRSPIRVTLVNEGTTSMTVTVGLFAISQS